MPLEIITGGHGSGKSSFLYNRIKENRTEHPDCNAIVIVPEQFSYTAEKTLSDCIGGLGANNVEVLTFSRLVNRFVKSDFNLLASGKAILLKRATKEVSEDNVFMPCANKSGFCSALSNLFAEFKRYNITSEDIDNLSFDSASAEAKMKSINEIYKNYNSFFTENINDSDDALHIFANLVLSSDIFSNTYVYIDCYNDFMPQHFTVIKAFLKKSKGMYISLGIKSNSDFNIFKPIIKTKSRLVSLCDETNQGYKITALSKNAEYITAPDIKFLLDNWEEKTKYPNKCENIFIYNALDLYSEVEHTASEIISLVRDHGYRFRDIGIITGSSDEYLHILTSVFSDFNIPVFTDEKIPVSMHPIAKTVLSLFRIINENWSCNSVFDYLRSGYIYIKENDCVFPISQEDVDLLENYVLQFGIKGKKDWFSPWTQNGESVFDDVTDSYISEDYDLGKLNILRELIITPFSVFLKSKGRTSKAIAEAFFNFMSDINLYEGILVQCAEFDKLGLRDESEQFKLVWNFIIETLDQLVSLSEGGTMSRETFFDYFSEGISQCEISIIPSGIDRVSLGTISRNSPTRVKALFIIGAAYGKIPKTVSDENILSDYERIAVNDALKASNKELAPDNKGRILLENLKLFTAITTASERLYLSWPSSDGIGNSVAVSTFVLDVRDMFDIAVKDNILTPPSPEELLSSAEHGFYYMLQNLSQFSSSKPEKLWEDVRNWYANQEKYKERLILLNKAAEFKKLQPRLSRIKAQMLYGENKRYSITALEKYSQCPFSYYLERGLKLKQREEKRVKSSYLGSIMHKAIHDFCEIVGDGASFVSEIHERWLNLTNEKALEIISLVMNDIKEKVLSRANSDKNQLNYILNRCEHTLKKSIQTVLNSLKLGEYAPICYEKNFEILIDWKGNSITLVGKIDRIDVMEALSENSLNLRIIDYKTGSKDFSLKGICDKVDMQLVLYAVAAEEMFKSEKIKGLNLKPRITGMLYDKIHEPELKEKRDFSVIETSIFEEKSEKLDGLVFLPNGSEVSDENLKHLNAMDSVFADTGVGSYLSASILKDGNFSKKSGVASYEDFETMKNYVKKSATEIDLSIKSGKIDITPYKNGLKSPCTYCDFKTICLFDQSKDCYRNSIDYSKSEDCFNYMKKEVSENE